MRSVGLPTLAMGVVLALVGVKLGLHVIAAVVTPYEFHRDEFLYFAMGEHLSLFHMDFPPAIAMIAAAVRTALGDSLLVIRLVPAVFSTALVVMASLIARELGGRRLAQGLAAVCVIANPLFLRSGALFQPVVLDQLAWTVGIYALVRLARSEESRWWVLLGIAAGVGLLSKFTIGVFGVAVIVALFATRRWSWLKQRGPWVALALALVIGLPSVIGQMALKWPVVSYLGDLRSRQLARVTAMDFLAGQLQLGPATIVAAAGLAYLVLAREMRPFRLIGWVGVATVVLFLVAKAKDYYLGPLYPTWYAAGAVFLGRLPQPRVGPMVRWGTLTLVVMFGTVALPLGLPILPPPQMATYAARVAGEGAVTTNVGVVERLPQDYADMLGWKDLVATVAAVYDGLPRQDRERAVILASNYGEAGAIDFYGPRYGLPRAMAFVGTYWHYGPGDETGEVTVAVGFRRESLASRFARVDSVAVVGHPYGVEEQRDQVVHVARHPHRTLQELWPGWKGEN